MHHVAHLHVGPVKAILFIADIAHAFARDILDTAQNRAGAPHFATNDDKIGGGKCFTPYPADRILGQKRIENGVRNPVANLIGVAL